MDKEKIKQLYFKYRLIIWPVVTGLSCVVVLAFVIIPQITGYFKVKDEISQLNNRSSSLEAKAEELSGLNEETGKKNLQTVFNILPTDRDVPQAMSVLTEIVTRSGLTLSNTGYVSTLKSANNKESFQLAITVTGSIENLKNFLLVLQEAPRLFQIESIDVQYMNNGDVSADIPISVFYEASPKTMGSVDQPVPKLDEKQLQLLASLEKYAPKAMAALSATSSANVPLGKVDPFE